MALGYSANVAAGVSNAAAIGASTLAAESNMMAFGNNLTLKWGFGRTVANDGGAALQVGIIGGIPATGNGAYLSSGGVWTNASDENVKENFVVLNKSELLNKISQLSIMQWDYKGTPKRETHIGPTAQQFKQLFGLGIADNNTSISTIDPVGVALAGIQELTKLVSEQQATITALKEQVIKLEAKLKENR